MRFFHLADLHLGKVVHGFSMLADQRYVLEQVLQAAHQQRPAAVLLAGDLYDRAVPSGGAVALLNWFLTQLAEAHIPCLAIAGNHDSGVRIGFASKILEKQGLYLSGHRHGGADPRALHRRQRDGRCVAAALSAPGRGGGAVAGGAHPEL